MVSCNLLFIGSLGSLHGDRRFESLRDSFGICWTDWGFIVSFSFLLGRVIHSVSSVFWRILGKRIELNTILNGSGQSTDGERWWRGSGVTDSQRDDVTCDRIGFAPGSSAQDCTPQGIHSQPHGYRSNIRFYIYKIKKKEIRIIQFIDLIDDCELMRW